MRTIGLILFTFIANTFALLLANYFLRNVELSGSWQQVLALGVVLSVLNYFLKPLMKLLFGPLILLTFGLGYMLINLSLIYLLDILSNNFTIEQDGYLVNLFYVTAIVSVINALTHWASRKN